MPSEDPETTAGRISAQVPELQWRSVCLELNENYGKFDLSSPKIKTGMVRQAVFEFYTIYNYH